MLPTSRFGIFIATICAASSASAAIVAPNGVVLISRGNGFERATSTVQLATGDMVMVSEGSAIAICGNGTSAEMGPGSVYTIGSTACSDVPAGQQPGNATSEPVTGAADGPSTVGGQGGEGSSSSGTSGGSGGSPSTGNGSGNPGSGGVGTVDPGVSSGGTNGISTTGMLVGIGALGLGLGVAAYAQSQKSSSP